MKGIKLGKFIIMTVTQYELDRTNEATYWETRGRQIGLVNGKKAAGGWAAHAVHLKAELDRVNRDFDLAKTLFNDATDQDLVRIIAAHYQLDLPLPTEEPLPDLGNPS